MQTLVETVFTGKWRSFKSFKRSGEIRLNTEKKFKEFEFSPDRELVIKAVDETTTKKLAGTDQWSVLFKNKRHYLNVDFPKLLYEVITVNHTVMVLADTASEEKIFFARDIYWNEYLKNNHLIII